MFNCFINCHHRFKQTCFDEQTSALMRCNAKSDRNINQKDLQRKFLIGPINFHWAHKLM